MYHVIRQNGNLVVERSESLAEAKKFAEHYQEQCKAHFGVFRVEQIWTTQTLEEALAVG